MAAQPADSARERFVERLAELRRRSPLTIRAIAADIDRPASTVGGWFSGKHLPYARDTDDVVRVLALLGVDDPTHWLRELEELRGDRHRETPSTRRNPYLGLAPFGSDDADHFFGREELTAALVDDVTAGLDETDPLIVVGASGSGKTSLLRAGLLPVVTRHGLAAHYVDCGDPTADIRIPTTESASSVWVLDQFEQLLADGRRAELHTCCRAVERTASRPGAAVVIVLRADWFATAAAERLLSGWMTRRLRLVVPPDSETLRRCVLEPAIRAGLTVEPDLLARMLADFDLHDPDAAGSSLPLLSHVMHEVAERAVGDRLTLSAYAEVGGLARAIDHSAETAVQELGPDRVADVRRLMLGLAQVESDGQVTRRVVPAERLDPRLRATAEPFVHHRLLVADEAGVTLAHEALLTAWSRLRDWVDAQRDALRLVARVATLRSLWEEAERDDGALVSGRFLAEIEDALSAPDLRALLGDRDAAFVRASSAAHEARERVAREKQSSELALTSELLRSRDPTRAAALALEAHTIEPTVASRSALIAAATQSLGQRFVGRPGANLLAATPDWLARAAADRAELFLHRRDERGFGPAHRLVLADGPAELSALVAAPSGRRVAVAGPGLGVIVLDAATGTPHAVAPVSDDRVALAFLDDDTLFVVGPTGVERWMVPTRVGGRFGVTASTDLPGVAVAVGPDRVAVVGPDGALVLLDVGLARDGVNLARRDARPIMGLAFSPGGDLLAAACQSGAVEVWNVAAADRPLEVETGMVRFGTWVNAVAFDPAGTMLAAASSDGTVRIWDTTTWRELAVDVEHPGVIETVAFIGPRSIATTGEDGIVRTVHLPEAGDRTIWELEHSADGSLVMVTGESVEVRAPGRAAEVAVRADVSGAATISPDGSLVAVGGRDGVVRVGPADQLASPAWVLDGPAGLVESVRFSPDGRGLAAVDRAGHVHLWRVQSAAEPVELGGLDLDGSGRAVSLSTTGIVAVGGDDGAVVIGEQDTAAFRERFDPRCSFVLALAFHPNGSWLAIGGGDHTVRLWDVGSAQRSREVACLDGPTGNVMTVAFDPAGTRLAAGSTDGTIWLWRVGPDGTLELDARVNTGRRGVYDLSFHPTDDVLVSGGPRGSLDRWDLDESVLLARLHARSRD